MDDFGHAIGVPSGGGLAQPYGPPPGQATAQPDLDLASAHAQARARAEAGDLTGARTMIEEVLAAGELRLGRDHPALVPLMVDLASLARRLGNLTEAVNQLRRAYAIVIATDGPQHPTALAVEGRLAAALHRLGEPTEAYDWHLADAGRRILGDDHPAVRGAQQRLGGPVTPALAPPFTPPVASPPARYTPPPVPVPYQPMPPPPPPTAAPPGAGDLVGPALVGDIWDSGDATVRSRRPGTGVVLVASLGAVVLVVAVVVALALLRPAAGPPAAQGTEPAPGPTTTADATPTVPASPPPGELRIVEDSGGAVTLTWLDPSAGQVPFVVSGGRQGDALIALVSVEPGETTTTIYGLNVNFNYCFTVAAVWSADLLQASMRTCTHRSGVSPSPA